MDAIIGMLLLVLFGACVIFFAAATTWLVVKISPTK